MIRRSSAIAIAAVLLSLLVHLMGLSFTSGEPPEGASGDTSSDVVELGNAFEDVAEAQSEPVQPEPAPVPEPPVEKAPEPENAEMPTSEALVASVDPQPVFAPGMESAKAVQPDTTGPSESEKGETAERQTAEQSGSDEETVSEADTTSAIEPAPVAQAPEGAPDGGSQPVKAVDAEPALSPSIAPVPQQLAAVPALVAPVAPVPEPTAVPVIPLERETIDPETVETTEAPASEGLETGEVEDDSGVSELAVVASPRPRLPSRRPSAEPEGQRDGSAEFSELLSPALVESPLTAYRRDRTDPTIRQSSRGQSGGLGFAASRNSGNSDVTNYAGQVLAHLNRTPLVPVSGRGFARVFFEINPDGSLAWVNVIDGTGSQEIDRAAKQQVRSAAPFPTPPQGAKRKLVFVYRIN